MEHSAGTDPKHGVVARDSVRCSLRAQEVNGQASESTPRSYLELRCGLFDEDLELLDPGRRVGCPVVTAEGCANWAGGHSSAGDGAVVAWNAIGSREAVTVEARLKEVPAAISLLVFAAVVHCPPSASGHLLTLSVEDARGHFLTVQRVAVTDVVSNSFRVLMAAVSRNDSHQHDRGIRGLHNEWSVHEIMATSLGSRDFPSIVRELHWPDVGVAIQRIGHNTSRGGAPLVTWTEVCRSEIDYDLDSEGSEDWENGEGLEVVATLSANASYPQPRSFDLSVEDSLPHADGSPGALGHSTSSSAQRQLSSSVKPHIRKSFTSPPSPVSETLSARNSSHSRRDLESEQGTFVPARNTAGYFEEECVRLRRRLSEAVEAESEAAAAARDANKRCWLETEKAKAEAASAELEHAECRRVTHCKDMAELLLQQALRSNTSAHLRDGSKYESGVSSLRQELSQAEDIFAAQIASLRHRVSTADRRNLQLCESLKQTTRALFDCGVAGGVSELDAERV